ncbi:MAG: MBL fold metallo-hydrolase [Opitutales bacterium]
MMHDDKMEGNIGWSRRGFIRGLGLSAGAGFLAAGSSGAFGSDKAPAPSFKNGSVYHFRIGEIDAWSISDGEANLGNPMHLMHPEEERPNMKKALSAVGEPPDKLPLYINLLVLRIRNEVTIIDSGFGEVENPRLGWLREGLEQIGIHPDQVTAAFLSHAHVDHINGFVTPNGKAAFPNAAIHALQAEEDFWLGPNPDFSMTKRDPRGIPGMVENAKRKFDALRDNRQPLQPGAQLFGGAVTVQAAPGHTAGHAIYRIRSGSETLLHISDMAHHQVLMFADPDWMISLDDLPHAAAATRRKEFAKAAETRERVFGFHLPWPGLGRIIASGGGYSWVPEPLHWL